MGGASGGGGGTDSGGVSGKGGLSGSGGESASGGTTASGGAAGIGGASSAGGTTGSGGGTARGGAAGAGGTGGASSAGATGSGGSTARGGATSAGGTGGASSAGATGSGGSTAKGGTTSSGGATMAGGNTGAGGTTSSTGAGGTGAGGSGPGGVSGRDAGVAGSAGGATGRDAGTGADGNPVTYQPCPASGNPCKILPLGDSITYGVNDEGNAGYRGPLFASAVAAGQKITFTGSLSNGPNTVSGQTFPKNNEGHSGWGISEVTPYSNGVAGIATRIPSPAFDSSSGGVPNIVLLHIGTNDSGSFSATQMTSDLKGLLATITADAPDALLVVAQIIPLGYGTNDVIKAYNQAIPGLVQQLTTAGKHVVVVDMYTGFTPSTMLGSDNIHPNTTGYKFMADHWYSAIGSLLPK